MPALSTATVSAAASSSAEFVVAPLFMPKGDYRAVEQQGVPVTVCWLVSGVGLVGVGMCMSTFWGNVIPSPTYGLYCIHVVSVVLIDIQYVGES